MKRYTVVWSPPAETKLAALWEANPAIRMEFSAAVNWIDSTLAQMPQFVGVPEPASTPTRLIVRPPISLLFETSEEDRLVRVIEIKLWDE
jgi:hypothetical protein